MAAALRCFGIVARTPGDPRHAVIAVASTIKLCSKRSQTEANHTQADQATEIGYEPKDAKNQQTPKSPNTQSRFVAPDGLKSIRPR